MMTNEQTDSKSDATPAAAGGRFQELQQMVAAMQADFDKFYKDNNKAAGTRVRLAMQELKNFAQTIRTEVQSIKNGGKPGDAAADDAAE
jgi:hypothetical protein